MALEEQVVLLLYIVLGAVAAMVYALRRIFLLERKILGLEKIILQLDKKFVDFLAKKRK